MEQRGRLQRADGVELAWALLPGRSPTVVFLPGFGSDMEGSKALALRDWCATAGQALLRFDYSGHGASGGRFTDGCISLWAEDARTVIASVCAGKLLLVGSSMGGWIALLTALALPERTVGLMGIAAAPDFTEDLLWPALPPDLRQSLWRDGEVLIGNGDEPPLPITRALIEDGRRHLLLRAPIALTCPVRLVHGQADADVPWQTALRLAEQLVSTDVAITLVKDGDHRLSRPRDLALLTRTLTGLLADATPASPTPNAP